MTPQQLEAQTVRAFKAWRKDQTTEILWCDKEDVENGDETWCDAGHPTWDACDYFRIAPKPRKRK